MGNSDRAHPDAIFVRFTGAKGFGFTYIDEEAFAASADHFLAIALAREEDDTPEIRHQACHDQLWRVFADPMGEQYTWHNVRWIAAAAVRDKYGYTGPIPRVVVVENAEDDAGIVIRAGDEFLDHPGWPRALVVGHPAIGGGPATYFSSRESFEVTAKRPMSDDLWLPQIVDRLYEVTPSVVMGMPKSDKEGKMQVQCRALAFGTKASLKERAATD
ncbi:MAG: hypothetical protein GKS03_14535 [Alphaproteobacteria bacterium]|nr:hypothetical protein [Alphaproteobacteria bacterium]